MFLQYTGNSDRRTVSTEEFAAAGLDGASSVSFDASNGKVAEVTKAVGSLLLDKHGDEFAEVSKSEANEAQGDEVIDDEPEASTKPASGRKPR